MRAGVPETRRVRRDFIRNDNPAVVAAKLQFEVNQFNADILQVGRQGRIGALGNGAYSFYDTTEVGKTAAAYFKALADNPEEPATEDAEIA